VRLTQKQKLLGFGASLLLCAGLLWAQQPVDVLQLQSAAPSATNPLPVRLSDGAAFLVCSTLGEQQTQTIALQLIDDVIKADDAAFTVATDKVAVAGGLAVAIGADPDALDAADAGAGIMTRHRQRWVLGGHPNIRSTEWLATTAQTNDPLVTVAAGSKIVVTAWYFDLDAETTNNAKLRCGFGTASVPTEPVDGATVDGVVIAHDGPVPGGGISKGDGSGVLGMGVDDEDFRCTNEDPTGTNGSIKVVVTWFTLPS